MSLRNENLFLQVENWFDEQRRKGIKRRPGRPRKDEKIPPVVLAPVAVEKLADVDTSILLTSRRQRSQGPVSGGLQQRKEGRDRDSSADSTSIIKTCAGLERIVIKQDTRPIHSDSASAALSDKTAKSKNLTTSPSVIAPATTTPSAVQDSLVFEKSRDFSEAKGSIFPSVPERITGENPITANQEEQRTVQETPTPDTSPKVINAAEPKVPSRTEDSLPSPISSNPETSLSNVVSDGLATRRYETRRSSSTVTATHTKHAVSSAPDPSLTAQSPVGRGPEETSPSSECLSPSPAPSYMTRRSMSLGRAAQNSQKSDSAEVVERHVHSSKGFSDKIKQIMIDFHDNERPIPQAEDFPELERRTGLRTEQVYLKENFSH